MLKQVEINSVNVDDYIVSFEIERVYGDAISQVSIKVLKTITDVVTLANGQTLELWRGWTLATDEKVFDGYIEKYEVEGGIIKITGLDKMWDLVRKEVTHIYDSTIDASAGVISEIFEDLVETYGGLTAEMQASGSVIVIDKFVCNHTDIFERCKKLAEILDWQMYYRADTDNVYFEPKGFTDNANTLTVGSNVQQVPKWNYDITEMVNDVTVVGAYQEVETTESGKIGTTAGYTTADITIAYEPISVKVYGDAGDPPTTLKVGGVVGSTSSYDYYVDKNQKKIVSSSTFTTDDYYEIRYSYATPLPVRLYNQTSIDAYGQFKKTVTFTDIRTVEDALTRGRNYLAKYSTPFIYTTLRVKNVSTYGLQVGQMIRVIDDVSSPTVDSWLLINRHRIRYPADYDEIEVGDKYWRLASWQAQVEEKLKRIAEASFSNQDIVLDVVDLTRTVIYQRRYMKVMKKVYPEGGAIGVFLLDNELYGLLDNNCLDDNIGGIEELSQICPGRSRLGETLTHEEYIYDNDFTEDGTTATVDTANNRIVF